MASLKDLLVMGPARFLDKLYGNLEGNATTADQWKTARTFTIGSKGWKVSGDNDVTWTHEEIGAIVSNTWTGGTTAGPTLSTTVNGVTGTAVAIPSASSAASGVVTIADQTFRGMKTFYGAVRGYMYNLNNNAPAFIFDKPSSHWTGIGACGENDTIFFGPCVPDGNVAGGYSWVADYNQKWKFQGEVKAHTFVISSIDADAHIKFSRTGWNYLVAPSASTIAINPTGNSGSGNTRLAIDSSSVYPGTNNGTIDLGTSSYQWKDAWFSGTVTLSKTTDAAGTANNQPALIVGGTATTAHLELDNNELMAKTNGTSVAELYLNSNGGLVHVGSGGLQIDEGNILSYSSSTTPRQIRVQNTNGSVSIYTSTNRGLYDITKDAWIIYRAKDAVTTYIPEWASIGAAADRPIYMSSSGRPAITTYRMAATNATATSAHSITTDLPTGIWYVNGTSDILGQSDGVAIVNQYSSSWITEIYQDYRTGQIAVRGKNSGTWQAWRKILDSSNYSTWALPLSGGTMTGLITGKTNNTSWIGTSRNGAFRTETAASGGSANAVISMKTNTGAWGIANLTGSDNLYFVFGTDANYSAGNNTTNNYYLNTSGYFSGSCSYANSAGSVAWGNVTGKPSFNYLPLTGGTLSGLLNAHGGISLNSSTPNETPSYILGIRAFADGGNIIWQSIGSVSVGYATSAGSANSVAWGNVTGKPSTFAPSSHTHSYLPLTGGSVTGAISITTNGVTNSFYSQNSSFTHYSTSASVGHWFNKSVYVAGEIYAGTSYNQIVYHMGNIIYSSTEPTAPYTGAIWLKPV